MTERLIDAWLINGNKHKVVAMEQKEVERTQLHIRVCKKIGHDIDLKVGVDDSNGIKDRQVDDIWLAEWMSREQQI